MSKFEEVVQAIKEQDVDINEKYMYHKFRDIGPKEVKKIHSTMSNIRSVKDKATKIETVKSLLITPKRQASVDSYLLKEGEKTYWCNPMGLETNLKKISPEIAEYVSEQSKNGIHICYIFSGELTKFAKLTPKSKALEKMKGGEPIICQVYNEHTLTYTFLGKLILHDTQLIQVPVFGGKVTQEVFYFRAP